MSRLTPPPPPNTWGSRTAAQSLARDAFGREIAEPEPTSGPPPDLTAGSTDAPRKEKATDAIGRRAGALADELDFPAFVASLVHGTFDAIVDTSIRQMEAFADLVAAVAKPLDQFTEENVTLNQARDFLVDQHPRDVQLSQDGGEFRLVPRPQNIADGEEPQPPAWLAEYGHEGAELSQELLEEEVLPQAREKVAKQRLQTLATMVLLGMNRVVVKDGSVAARLRFRAAASDHAAVQYATSDDPEAGRGAEWGERGSRTYSLPSTKVSTVGVNVQSDSDLKAELFGEVKINFVSETVPLDRFVDQAQRTLLERHARSLPTAAAISPPPASAAPGSAPPPAAPIPPAAGGPA